LIVNYRAAPALALVGIAVLVLAACGGGGAGGAEHPSGPVTIGKATDSDCRILDQRTRQGTDPNTPRTALIVDKTASRGADTHSLPPGVLGELAESQRRGDLLVTIAVNGDGAQPRRLPDRMLKLDPTHDSTSVNKARGLALSCVARWSLGDTALPTAEGTNLTAALAEAAHQSPTTIIVVSDGWTTSGTLDVAAVGPDADPTGTAFDLAKQLPRFPSGDKISLKWFGIGGAALTGREDLRNSLKALWKAVLATSGIQQAQIKFEDATSDDSQRVPGADSQWQDPVQLSPPPVVQPKSRSIPSVLLFSPGQATLLPEATSHLVRIAEWLQGSPTSKVLITGHTAQYGTEDYRDNLSKRRAEAVLSALVKLHIDRSRLTAKGVGSHQQERPEFVGGRHDPVAARANRRVTIEILPA
jgi:outer membrane protein OmpA-like peptidoglycan-associated protein